MSLVIQKKSSEQISEALRHVKSVMNHASRVLTKDMLVGNFYKILSKEGHAPRWNQMSNQKVAQELGVLTDEGARSLDTSVFNHVRTSI